MAQMRKILRDGTYMTRRLKAGAEVDFIPEHYGKIFDRIGRTEPVLPDYNADVAKPKRGRPATTKQDPAPKKAAPQTEIMNSRELEDSSGGRGEDVQKNPEMDDRAMLRAEYEKLLGKRPYMGWDADELREKIAEHRKSSE